LDRLRMLCWAEKFWIDRLEGDGGGPNPGHERNFLRAMVRTDRGMTGRTTARPDLDGSRLAIALQEPSCARVAG
jgi:hypothetical protein